MSKARISSSILFLLALVFQLVCGPLNSADKAEVESVKLEIKNLCETKLQALRVRSRIKIFEQDEKNTAFFFRRIKQRNETNVVESVQEKGTGQVIDDSQGIVRVYQDFYSDLYTAVPTARSVSDFFLDFFGRSDYVNSDSTEDRNCPFSIPDIKQAIMSMENNKTPGPDGLPKEFYAIFVDVLTDDMCEVFNNAFETKVLPKSMTEAVTILLHKGGDQSDPKNKRPISLLNVDYKVLAKVVNKWLVNFYQP